VSIIREEAYRIDRAAARDSLRDVTPDAAGAREDVEFAARLRRALEIAGAAGAIGSQVSHAALLELIVATAVQVLHAEAGALLLVDEGGDELVFEVAVGGKADTVKAVRVPIGHGVAGLVALTGQPMAVSDAERDAAAARDIAEQVGYLPRSLLCVPLFYADRIVGVLELLDKEGGGAFTRHDTESLRLFANQAAVAIEHSRVHASLVAMIGDVLGTAADGGTEAAAFAARVEQDPGRSAAVELAALVQEISSAGVEEQNACRALLEGFAAYLRTRSATGSP
jgi:GAF domain-containing protein